MNGTVNGNALAEADAVAEQDARRSGGVESEVLGISAHHCEVPHATFVPHDGSALHDGVGLDHTTGPETGAGLHDGVGAHLDVRAELDSVVHKGGRVYFTHSGKSSS